MDENKANDMLDSLNTLTMGIMKGPKTWRQKKIEQFKYEDTASIIDEISRLLHKAGRLNDEVRERLEKSKF